MKGNEKLFVAGWLLLALGVAGAPEKKVAVVATARESNNVPSAMANGTTNTGIRTLKNEDVPPAQDAEDEVPAIVMPAQVAEG